MTTLLASFVAIGSILLGPSTAAARPGDAPAGAAAWADALWTAALADDQAKVEELLKAAPADDSPAMQKVRERVAERARNHETRNAERKTDLEKHEKEMGEHVTKGELLKALVDGANIRYLLSEAEWKQRGTAPAFRDLVKTALAEATKAIIVGFNVTSNAKARALAEAKGVEMRLYEVIYDLTDDVAKAASGLLEPELKLEVLGHAEVREVFKISKVGAIAGCYVTDGVVERNAQIRVTRGGIVVEKDRRLEQLKRFKDDAKEVRAGTECGMKIVGYDDIKVGDVLECYKTVTVQRS